MAIFKVLDVWRVSPNEPAYYRVLVGGDTVKYFVVDEPADGRFDYHETQHLAFEAVPDGDWTLAHLAHAQDNKLVIASVEKKRLPDVADAWYPAKINLQSLGKPVDPVWADDMFYVGFPWAATFNGPPGHDVPRVLAVWEQWYHHPSYSLTPEIQNRGLIDGHDIAPRFVGHLTENGDRIIGYLVESVDARPASIGDLAACRAVLQRLHSLGLAHGRLRRDNFLILENGHALLKDFFLSHRTNDQSILDAEMAKVEEALATPLLEETDDSHIPPELIEQLEQIRKRDGGMHPVIQWEAMKEGRITITQEEHRALLDILWHEGGQRWMDEHMEHALRCREANGGRWYPMSYLHVPCARLVD